MDPALRAILDALPPAGEPGTPAESRAAARHYTELMGLDTPGRDQLRITERTIPGPAADVPIRIYEPLLAEGSRPAAVYFHGGGFIAGDLDTEDVRCVRLAADGGCVVVSVDYRLAPEHPFPAALDDCDAALRWTFDHASELGLDPDRIGVAGGSAGGTLAAAVALLARDRGAPAIAFQLLVYPALDDRLERYASCKVGLPVVDARGCASVWRHYLGRDGGDVTPFAAPSRAEDLRGLPPAYVLTAELDPLRDQGIEYATRLLAADVPVELHHYADTFHGFDLMPSETSRRALDEQARWVREIVSPRTP